MKCLLFLFTIKKPRQIGSPWLVVLKRLICVNYALCGVESYDCARTEDLCRIRSADNYGDIEREADDRGMGSISRFFGDDAEALIIKRTFSFCVRQSKAISSFET